RSTVQKVTMCLKQKKNMTTTATIFSKVRRFRTRIAYSLLACVAFAAGTSQILAHDAHSHGETVQMRKQQQNRDGALLKIVRDSTERFKNVSIAVAEGYALQFGC